MEVQHKWVLTCWVVRDPLHLISTRHTFSLIMFDFGEKSPLSFFYRLWPPPNIKLTPCCDKLLHTFKNTMTLLPIQLGCHSNNMHLSNWKRRWVDYVQFLGNVKWVSFFVPENNTKDRNVVFWVFYILFLVYFLRSRSFWTPPQFPFSLVTKWIKIWFVHFQIGQVKMFSWFFHFFGMQQLQMSNRFSEEEKLKKVMFSKAIRVILVIISTVFKCRLWVSNWT